MTATTHISVLGPVRAWSNGQEVRLGSPQQRSVLALLAIAGARGVRMKSILDALWATHPPPSAINTIHTYIKRLRRLLDPHRPARKPSQLLVTVGDGYALRGEPDMVDLWRFRALVTRAYQARQAATPDQMVTILGEALRLWRGDPASDLAMLVDHPWLRATIGERGTAAGLFAEAALSNGLGAEALAIVEDAAAASPLDEPLHAHLIRTYHAVGRRSDAIRSYQLIRHRLQEELGLDPGPALDQAYRDLLSEHQQGQGCQPTSQPLQLSDNLGSTRNARPRTQLGG